MSAFGGKADICFEQVWQGNSLAREENWGQPYHFVLAYALTLTIATVHFTRRKSLLYVLAVQAIFNEQCRIASPQPSRE